MITWNLRSITPTVCLTVSTITQLFFPVVVRSAPRQCIPIAYVLSNAAWGWKVGDLLCVGDLIVLRSKQPLLVQCFGVGLIDLPDGQIPPSGCGTVRESGPWTPPGSSNPTMIPRGTNEIALQILEPSGSIISETRPRLSWQSVPGATSYRVWIFGDVSWSTTTTETYLPYPSRQPALRPGNAYRIIVSAYQEKQWILGGEQAVNISRSKISLNAGSKATALKNESKSKSD